MTGNSMANGTFREGLKVIEVDVVKKQRAVGGPIKLLMSNDGPDGTKNQLLAMGLFGPGEGLYPHLHNRSEESYYVLRGEGTVFSGPKLEPMRAKAGQVIYIPSKTPHCVTNTGKEDLHILFVLSPSSKNEADLSLAKDLQILEERIVEP